MLYVDTSVLVASFTNEIATARVQRWFAEQASEQLAISDWVVTEFSSALSIKMRTRHIGENDRAQILAAFTQIVADSFVTVPVTPIDFRTAARFADRHDLSLRAGDALHLAAASGRGATLCTLDQRLAHAGVALGANAVLV
ncbi:type II toxin-antitoxin system VapC family toxin [Mesorhizobium xinjiangense]|uniref:type II toxin-antitoxin system VapC family toxin n=1 Tax=Mesorhizobium xinjiangense TaxID=2678685 RepID=UPI0018DC4D1B|nr:type II toxin-antitoxin system VapC family toxin [Mesorhizobium xinjiangense]